MVSFGFLFGKKEEQEGVLSGNCLVVFWGVDFVICCINSMFLGFSKMFASGTNAHHIDPPAGALCLTFGSL